MPFLKAVRQFALHHNARAQLSLETRMACGVGACLGCVKEAPLRWKMTDEGLVTDGSVHVKVCSDGPVFEREVVE